MLRFNFVRQIIIALCFAASVSAKAQTEPPQFMTVDGRLYDSTTPEDPLLDNSVLMRIQVLNPAKTCILYEEEQTVSTLSSNGYFNVRVGSPTSGAESLKRTTNDSGNSMVSVFQNQSASISGRTSGGAGCSYTPTAGDTRYFRYIVTPSITGVTSTLSPDMQIDSVPQSLVAETLQGMSPDDFVQINSDVTQAKANSLFGGSYTTLTGLLAGTSSLYLRNTTNGTVLPSRATDPLTPAAGQIWYDSDDNVLRYFDGTVVQTLSSGSADPTKLPLAGGTMAGAIDMATNDITDIGHMTQAPQRTFRFGVYTTAQQTSLIATPLVAGHEGTVWYNTTTNKLMFWDGTAEYAVSPVDSVFGRTGAVVAVAGDYTAAQITNTAAGNIAATDAQAAINELDTEKVAKAGDSMGGALTMSAQNQVRFSDAAGGEYAAIQAPATIGANYVLTLPDTAGSASQVLTTDGTGVLSWTSLAAVGETNTASNQGIGGVGLYDAKSGVDLQFRNINAASNKVSVALDAGNKEVDINVNEANLDSGVIPNTAAGNIAATNVQAAINELDTEKAATTRAINTAAGSGLSGGGDLSADRSLSVNINGTTAETSVAGADEILIYDASASALRKMTRTNFVLSEAEVDAMVSNNGYLTAEADTLATVTGRGASTATNITMNTQAQTRYADSAGGEYAAIQAPATIGANYVLTLPDTAGSASQVLTTDGTGVLSWTTLAAVGETNTASNQGVGGVGLYDAKSGVDLQFRNINAASNKVSVALDAGNKEVDINVNEANLDSAVIPNTAAGNIAATNVQAAINELDTEKVAKSGDTMTGALNIDNEQELRLSEADGSGANYVAIKALTTLGANYTLTLPPNDGDNGQYLQTDGNGVLTWVTPAGVGETNTASNQGVGGVGVFKQKTTYDLEFRNINAASNKISVALDAGNNEIDINVNEANLSTAAIPNTAAGNIAATNTQAAINELDTEKVSTTRAINTAAGSGLAGGGDLSADRSLSVDINGTTAETAVAGADEILIYDASASALRKMTRTNFVLSEAEVDAMVANNGYLTSEADTLATVTGRGASTATNITMNTQAQTRYADSAGGEYAAIQAPTTISANYVLTLPTTAGSASQVLTTDGSGVLSWTTPSTTPSADSLDFTHFADAMTLDASTDIAVTGTNSLSITNSGTGNSFVVNDQAADTSPFVIDASGNVGIGTTTPYGDLTVEGSSAGVRDMLVLRNTSAGDGRGPAILFQAAATPGEARIAVTRGSNSSTSRMTFETEVGGTLGERMRIDVNGNIGIGTTVPSNQLHVRTSDAATNTVTNLLRLEHESSGTPAANFGTGLLFTGKSSTTSNQDMAQISSLWITATHMSHSSALAFSTLTNGSLTEHMRIDDYGRVGIRTTVPGTILDVAGAITSRPSGTGTGQTGQLIMRELAASPGGTDTVTVRAPDSITTSYALTLPATAGSANQVLTTDGSGVLSWTSGGAASIADDSLNFDKFSDSMTLDANTDIAVGSYVLAITNDGAGNSFRVNDNGAADTSPFVIDATGQVGAGTTTPTQKMHIRGSAGDTSLLVEETGTTQYEGPRLILNRTTGAADREIGQIVFESNAVAEISAWSDSASDTGSEIRFSTDLNGAGPALTQQMVIKENGRVGIGTTVPGTLLDVTGAITSRPHGTATGETGKLTMRELAAGGTDTATIRAPDAIATSYSLTLPTTAGSSGQVLRTDGAGVLTWIDVSSAANTFINNGNSFSGDATLGTNDNNHLFFETNGTNRVQIYNDGKVEFGGNAAYYSGDKKFIFYDNNWVSTTDFATVLNDTFMNGGSSLTGTAVGHLNQMRRDSVANSNNIYAAHNVTRKWGVGTLTNGVGSYNEFENNASTTTTGTGVAGVITAGAGTITNARSVYASMSGAGAVTNAYGIYIDTLIGTNKWGIYQNGASDQNYFAGSVGVGTSSPGAKLDIYGTDPGAVTAAGQLRLYGSATSGAADTGGGLGFAGHDGSSARAWGTIHTLKENSTVGDAASYMRFATRISGGAIQERVRISSTGALGIGTTVPETLLDVAGAITSRPHGTATGETGKMILRELAAGGTDTATIRAPDAISTSYSLTLPTTAGSSGQVLRTDGTGVLTWVNSDASIAADVLDFTHFSDAMTLDASTDIAATGTNVLSITNAGTGDSFRVNDQAADTSPFVIDASGNVGIGTTVPGTNTKLDVNGQIRTPATSITDGSVDFVGGNTVTTSFDCGSNITLANVRRGGSYTIVVTGTGTTQCNFSTAAGGDDAATVSYRFQPANGLRTSTSHTIYSLLRVGDIIYISWITGFQ